MSTPANNGGVLVQSDEMDIVNYLQEAERLRRRRAKIEEIRARMREARGESTEPEEVEEATDETEQQPEEKNGVWSKIMSKTGDVASASGRGLKEAPKQVLNNFKLKNVKTAKPNMNQNIYQHISGDTFGWRQLNKKGKPGKIWRPDKSATGKVAVVNHLGTALLVVGIAMDAIEIASAVRKDYKAGTKHNTVHTAAGVAGCWAGALPCAAAGAALGSAVPVVGSIIGGVVGGIVGSMGGSLLARGIAEAAMPVPDENQPVVDRTPGNCAICSEKFKGFAVFYLHFVEKHAFEQLYLYTAVAQRIGEERVDIEDTWFVTKAFVKATDKVESWQLDDIVAFNDRVMGPIDWNEEENCTEDRSRSTEQLLQIGYHEEDIEKGKYAKQQQEPATIMKEAQLLCFSIYIWFSICWAMAHCIASTAYSMRAETCSKSVAAQSEASNGEEKYPDKGTKVEKNKHGSVPVYGRIC